jgi:beta-xylosidase
MRAATFVASTALAFAATLGTRAAHADESRAAAPAIPSASGPLAADFPDPFVLPSDGAYYAFATGAAGRHVQVARSTDLASWAVLPDALPRLPAWASTEEGLTWAPTVLPRRGGYVLYYTTRDRASGFQCISRATSMWPEGPYVDDSKSAFVCQVQGPSRLCGSIDPSPFVDAQGHAYLLWKSDENSAACRKDSRIWAARLTGDGLGLAAAPRPLLARDARWEQPLIEGPSMVARAGSYFLFYSANWYESARYAIGYATCGGPLGPCTKVTTRGPLLASDGADLGPGGQEFFTGPDGATWMAYHAWTAPITRYDDGGARALHLARVTFPSARPLIAQQPGHERGRSTERVATKM